MYADGGDLGDDDDEGAGDEISVDNMLAAVREQEKKDKAQIKELKAKINQLLLDVDKQTKRAETAEENYAYEKMKGAAAAKRAQDEAEGRLILDSGTLYAAVMLRRRRCRFVELCYFSVGMRVSLTLYCAPHVLPCIAVHFVRFVLPRPPPPPSSPSADKITTAEEKLVALELEIDTLRMQRDELTKISGDEKITSSKLAQELQMMVHQGREKELEIEALRDKLSVRAHQKSALVNSV